MMSAGSFAATHRGRRLAFLVGAGMWAGVTLLGTGWASAESTWMDGSPPPEDFGLQDTAPQSSVSAYNWLYSSDGGAAVYADWMATGVDRTKLNTLSGGVATGMQTAIAAERR